MGVSYYGTTNPNWKGGAIRLSCKECACDFEVVLRATAKARKFCSNACVGEWISKNRSGAAHRNWKGDEVKKPRRGKADRLALESPRPIDGPYSKLGIARFCGHLTKKGRRHCAQCKPIKVGSFEMLRCSSCGIERQGYVRSGRNPPVRCKACDHKSRGGAGNSRWKGGITPRNKKIRASKEYAYWRQSVFERDKFTCVWCGQVGGKLNADHIKPFSMFPDSRFDVANGRTLCVPCHKQTDSYLSGARLKSYTIVKTRYGDEIKGQPLPFHLPDE